MSDQSAIRLLQSAIENVRENCKGPGYKDLLSAVDTADVAAEKCLGEPDDSVDDKVESQPSQPNSLKTASARAREQFAERRKTAS